MERIEVICLAAGPAELAGNVAVHSLGKERGLNRPARAALFYRTVWQLRSSVDAVFCQFSPEYVLAVAPIAKWKRWPIALWYTHRHAGLRLRLATLLADSILTASPESFGLSTTRLNVIGHGIDTQRFRPVSHPPARPAHPILLAVGRRAPIKNYEMLIDAAGLLVKDYGKQAIEVRIVGGDEGNAPPDYARSLQARIDRMGLAGVVKLIGPVPYDRIPAEYHAATLAVNLCPTGGMDKAVLEAMAAGLPALVRNATFEPVFGEDAGTLVLPDSDARAVAARLALLLDLPAGARAALGDRMQGRVEQGFGQQALVNRLAGALLDLKK
jgi:glycosyltransferase involved in cell wall biosynthesis